MDSKILIIDDDPTMLELLQALLSMEGFNVSTLEACTSLAEMLDHIKRINPALILCDVFLKDLDGLDLLRLVRQQPELNQVRILMSSGIDFSQQCLKAKADGFILKPYMPDDLIEMIQDILSARPN
jgi:CheY-like chemotaxis protein